VRRTRAAAALLVLAAGIALATVTPLAAAEPVRLTIGVIGPIGSIDIAQGTSDAANEVWKLQYPTLTGFAVDDLETVPGVADAWTANADGHGYTYTLGSATWSDGRPVTAADVASSLQRARDEDWPSAAGLLDGLDARVVDDHTVVITTTGNIGALPTLPLHIVPENGDSKVSAGDFVVAGAGNSEVRMEVVDRPGRPALDEIVFRSYSDAAALEHALGGGEVDIAAGFANDDLAGVRAIDGAIAIHSNDGDQWYLQARVGEPTLRQAIARAIDRDALVGSAVAGVGRPAVAPIAARGQEWQLDDAEIQTLAEQLRYAPDDAKTLVQALGTVPTLTLAAPDHAVGDAIADSVIAALDAVGISVERVGGAAADLTVARRDPTDDPTAALTQYTCSGGIWCDAEYDAAFARYSATSDPAVRQAAARTMVRRLTDGLPEIVLFAPDELQAYRVDNVAGIQRDPDVSRLVVFWPSAEQYRGMVPAAAAASEELPVGTFAALAIASAAVVTAGVVVIDRRIQARR
jgi:peptide/nickel transport system substrate-binding protein